MNYKFITHINTHCHGRLQDFLQGCIQTIAPTFFVIHVDNQELVLYHTILIEQLAESQLDFSVMR